MVAGLAFLSKKSFNPANLSNQKSVWQAEQESEKEKQRLREREKQLRIERDHEELARSRNGSKGGNLATLRFMYDAPPGLDSKKERQEEHDGFVVEGQQQQEQQEEQGGSSGNHTKGIGFNRQAGDDDAAAQFRLLLSQSNNSQSNHTSTTATTAATAATSDLNSDSITAASALILSGSTAEATKIDKSMLSQLEKAVGKRDAGSSLTYEEQIARFPQLKNAPMAMKRKADGGEDAMDTNVTFKPLGAQIRNVRCLKCGIWGHSRGDRECKLSGWDPFASVATAASTTPACSIMPPPSKKHGLDDGNGKKEKDDWDSDDDDESISERGRGRDRRRDSREKRRRKKSKHHHRDHKESKKHRKEKKRRKKEKKRYDRDRDRDDDRSRSRSRSRSYNSSDSDEYSSSYEERRHRRTKKDDRRRRHKRSRRRSPSYDSSRSR